MRRWWRSASQRLTLRWRLIWPHSRSILSLGRCLRNWSSWIGKHLVLLRLKRSVLATRRSESNWPWWSHDSRALANFLMVQSLSMPPWPQLHHSQHYYQYKATLQLLDFLDLQELSFWYLFLLLHTIVDRQEISPSCNLCSSDSCWRIPLGADLSCIIPCFGQ